VYGESVNFEIFEYGEITDVTVEFTVTFGASNIRCGHTIQVDGETYIDEEFNFDVPSSDEWDDAKKIIRTFSITKDLGDFTIRHEASQDWSRISPGTAWVWATGYELSIVDYSHTHKDPGSPSLSEDEFDIRALPGEDDPNDTWYRIQNKVITIFGPAESTQIKKLSSKSTEGRQPSVRKIN